VIVLAQQGNPFITLLCVATWVYLVILLLRFIVSLVLLVGARPPAGGPWRSLIDLLEDVTEPVLRPFRRWIPPVGAGGVGIDLSMMVVTVILIVMLQALGC
jgi:YggT family protein